GPRPHPTGTGRHGPSRADRVVPRHRADGRGVPQMGRLPRLAPPMIFMAVPFPLASRWSQLGPVGATWYRARVTLRSNWRGWVAVAVVLGLSGGVALAALAGARRTASVF